MIALRAARADDAPAIAAIYAPHVMAGVASFETRAPDAGEMAVRMASSDGLYPWLVALSGPADDPEAGVLGYAYAARFRERAAYAHVVESTIYLADVAQRQGVGRLLYEALVDTLRAQGFVAAIGAVALPNPGSIALHEAVGFRRAGVLRGVGFKHGQWIDVGYWQCQLNEPSVPAPAIRPFSQTGMVRG